MTTLNRSNLPDILRHKGREYKLSVDYSHMHNSKQKFDNKGMILVKVLNRQLKNAIDLRGQPYKPTEWIFIRKPAN